MKDVKVLTKKEVKVVKGGRARGPKKGFSVAYSDAYACANLML